jgi:hypothetical protein
MKTGAILQSNYIPWKGYFDILRNVDTFIFHDDVQYTSGDWRNRNKIKSPNGLRWLTIPCGRSEKRLICDVELIDSKWQKDHWNLITQFYKKSPYFNIYKDFFEEIYLGRQWKKLSEFNQYVIKKIATDLLASKVHFDDSRNYSLQAKKAERVKELLQKANIKIYLSGPSAKNYLDDNYLNSFGIELIWMDYIGYPEYNQLYPPFDHHVSIIDLIFNEGDNAVNYMKAVSFN